MKNPINNPVVIDYIGKIILYFFLGVVLYFLFGAAKEQHRSHLLREYEEEHYGLRVDTVLYNVDLDDYEKELQQRREDALRLRETPRPVPIRQVKEIRVTVTRYNPVRPQCDSTPSITADGSKIKTGKEKWIAISPDLLEHFKYGDRITLTGTGSVDGTYTIHDRMNPRWIRRIDILTPGTTAKGKWTGTIKKESPS